MQVVQERTRMLTAASRSLQATERAAGLAGSVFHGVTIGLRYQGPGRDCTGACRIRFSSGGRPPVEDSTDRGGYRNVDRRRITLCYEVSDPHQGRSLHWSTWSWRLGPHPEVRSTRRRTWRRGAWADYEQQDGIAGRDQGFEGSQRAL